MRLCCGGGGWGRIFSDEAVRVIIKLLTKNTLLRTTCNIAPMNSKTNKTLLNKTLSMLPIRRMPISESTTLLEPHYLLATMKTRSGCLAQYRQKIPPPRIRESVEPDIVRGVCLK